MPRRRHQRLRLVGARPAAPTFFNPDYTSINRFMIASSGDRSVRNLNDIGHLRPHPHLILR
ncbi:MAG: hypothetical protein R2710_28660 [Acidimicrobiales bacterium]